MTVTDHAGNTVLSSPISFSVTPSSGGPAITSFGASRSWVYVGDTTYLNVSATGGTLPYSYVFTNLPIGCVSSDTSSLECLPTAAGTYGSVTVTVTDSKAAGATSNPLTITVYSFPTIEAFSASPMTIPLGGTAYLNVSAIGGETPYSYAYDGLPSGCPSANRSQLVCVPSFAGVYQAMVVVTDHHGKTSSAQVTFRVSSLGSSIDISSFTAGPDSIPLGNTTTLAVLASGGSGIYTYTYTNLPPGCLTKNVASLSCKPTSLGTFSIDVRVTDSSGDIAMGTVSLVVTAAEPKLSHGSPSAFPWLYVILAVVVALLVALLLVFIFRRRKQSRYAKEREVSAEPSPPSPWPPKELIPPAPPGYLEGVTFHRPTPEWVEKDEIAYGTYPITEPAEQESTEAARSYPTSRAQPDAYIPWVIRIEPDGIKVDRQSGKPGVSQAVRDASASPTPLAGHGVGGMVLTPDAAQRILQGLSQRPMSINTIRENVTIPRDLLLGVLAAMSAAKLVLQGVDNRTGETVYVVTPSGRKLSALRSSEQGAGKSAPTEAPEPLNPRSATVSPARKVSSAKGPTTPQKRPPLPSRATLPIPSEDPEDEFERGTAVSETIRDSIRGAESGVTVGDLKSRLSSLDVSAAELYSRLATMEAEGRVHAVRGKTIDETRLYLSGPPAIEPSDDDRVHVDDSLLQSLKAEMEERDGHDGGSPAGGSPGSSPPSGTPAEGNVRLERVIGPRRSEDSPFGPGLRPEEVNPNVQHLDPKLLQPMEMRVSKDRGTDTRDTSLKEDPDVRAKLLMAKARREREKMQGKRDRYGSEQAEKPADGHEK